MTNDQLYLNALASLRPYKNFSIINEVLSWEDGDVITPTEAEIQAEMQRLNYRALREAEYPPITDYLDGVVKGDQNQINKYIADCLAVKAKYPKESS